MPDPNKAKEFRNRPRSGFIRYWNDDLDGVHLLNFDCQHHWGPCYVKDL